MAKKKSTGAGQIIPERIMDWSGGQNNAVNVALLNDNESRLLQNYSLDEKGTLFPFPGSLKRYAVNLGSSPVSGMGKLYKSDGTSRFLIGLEDGKLYVDSPHLVNQYDTQAEFNGGGNFAVQADAGGKLWPMIITTGFEDGLFDDFQTHDSGWTIDTAVYKTGAKSAKGTGTTQKLIREFGFNAGQLYVKMAVRFAEINQLHYPVILVSPSSTEIQAVVADTDGHFKYHNGTALANFPTDKTYAANTWYIVEVWVRGGTFWVSIDGVSLTPSGLTLKDTANAAQTQASKLQIQNAGGTSATTWIDDVEINLLAGVFSRSTVAYKESGAQTAVNIPRYEAGKFNNGVHMEESSAGNLLTANQASAETDTTGFTAMGTGVTISRDTTKAWHGTASIKVVCDGSVASQGVYVGISKTAGTAVDYAGQARVTGTGSVIVDVGGNADAGTNYQRTDLTLDATWQKGIGIRTSGTNDTAFYLKIYTPTAQAITFWVDGLQIESGKLYATSWQLPGTARVADSLYYTPAYALPAEWFVSGFWKPDQGSTTTFGRGLILLRLLFDTNNNFAIAYAYDSDKIYFSKTHGGTAVNLNPASAITYSAGDVIAFAAAQLTQAYGDLAAGMHLWVKVGAGSVVHTVNTDTNTPTAPTKFYIGCDSGTGAEANGVIDALKLVDLKTEAGLATVNNAWAEGHLTATSEPTADAATMLLANFNDNLDVSVIHSWITPTIDCSNASDKASGHAALTATTPGSSTVAIVSRSAPASTGPWTAWVAALGDGTLQHTADNYVQVRLTLTRSGENDPYIDKLTVSFDGQATATLLASDFSAGKQFFFDQLNDLLAVMTGDAPRKYDGTTLAPLAGSPPHAPYGVAHKNRFWMAKGSRLYFSDLLNIESWPVLNFIDIMPNDGDVITGMITFGDYLVIAKGHSVWMLIGETINTFRVRRIHSDRGCYAPRSLCIVNQMLCFVSDDGIYFSDFTQPVLISERIRKTWDGLNKRRLNLIASWFFDHKLYVAVPDAGQQRNNRVLVYDSLRQAFAGDRMWPVSCWTDFREAGEINSFFGRSDLGNVRKINTGYNDDGVTYEAIYESKAISHGAAEILKRYNIGYLQVKPAALDAELIISFIVDGVETPTMTVTVPANATGLIDTLQIFASEVGVVSGHRIQVKIRQQILDNPLGIQSVYLEALPLLIAPTLRG